MFDVITITDYYLAIHSLLTIVYLFFKLVCIKCEPIKETNNQKRLFSSSGSKKKSSYYDRYIVVVVVKKTLM